MLGYNYTVKRFDAAINTRLDSVGYRWWTEKDKELYRSLTLASWSTAGYSPRWPEKHLEEDLVTADHKNILQSVFRVPVSILVQHLSHDMKHDGPVILTEGKIIERGDLIRPKINHELLIRCDLSEIVEVDRWDMS